MDIGKVLRVFSKLQGFFLRNDVQPVSAAVLWLSWRKQHWCLGLQVARQSVRRIQKKGDDKK